MAAGDITFIACPYGDSFPVRKTSSRSAGTQQVVCPKCGHDFDVVLDETVERMSPETNLILRQVTRSQPDRFARAGLNPLLFSSRYQWADRCSNSSK